MKLLTYLLSIFNLRRETPWRVYIVLLLPLLWACQNDPKTETIPEVTTPTIPESLPMKVLPLSDLSNFKTEGKNWQIAGSIYADMNQKLAMKIGEGQGILANQPTESEKANIMTTFEHGDIDLEVDFLVPKGSNSGIYLQGRYELQILDSWGKTEVASGDCGGIYERWDDTKPEGQKGYEGTAPKVNACKAPGLWQHYKIAFQAPRFDAKGNKVANARFKKVYHNGVLIHDDVELTGPTRGPAFEGEAATGPLFIQGDHGPVAFKDFRYKIYTLDSLSLTDISYDFYSKKMDVLPDFSALKPVKTNQLATTLNLKELSEQSDTFAIKFKGTLHVPIAGDYLFTTRIDDGGELFIDGKSVVYNDGEPGYGVERGMVHLMEGIHDFAMTYYQDVWSAILVIDYEGPGIIKQSLASKMPVFDWQKEKPPILVHDLKTPEMIRGFANHRGEKKTNILSVGDPVGVHYSYDLRAPNLIKAWKGSFANVTNMWQDRGEAQLLLPSNAAIDLSDGVAIAYLENEEATWPDFVSSDFKFHGYEIDAHDRPVFKYSYKKVVLTDQMQPSEAGNSLVRTIQSNSPEPNLYAKIADANRIELLPNGYYDVDGAYYIKGESLILRAGKELLAKLEKTVEYEVLW